MAWPFLKVVDLEAVEARVRYVDYPWAVHHARRAANINWHNCTNHALNYIIFDYTVPTRAWPDARGELTSEYSVNWVPVILGLGRLGLGHSSENGLPWPGRRDHARKDKRRARAAGSQILYFLYFNDYKHEHDISKRRLAPGARAAHVGNMERRARRARQHSNSFKIHFSTANAFLNLPNHYFIIRNIGNACVESCKSCMALI